MDLPETAYWLEELCGCPLNFRKVQQWRVGSSARDDDTALAATANFADHDTGLALQDDPAVAVRCELIAHSPLGEAEAAAVVVSTADMISGMRGVIAPQPTVMLPNLVENTAIATAHEGATVAHGLLMPPRMWGENTPHVREEARMTLLLEVLLLTDEEHSIGHKQGMDVLLRRLRRRGVDFDDWFRG